MKCLKHIAALLLAGCFVLLPPDVRAAEEEPVLNQPFRFSVFGTLGLVYDDSVLHMQRDFGQPDTFHPGKYSLFADSLLGAQVDYKIADRFDATVQMVVKERAEQSFEESLDWAHLRWRPTDDLTFRAGRLGLDLYMLSDYRNVSYAYLWQRPVVEFYGPLMIQNFDGGDVSYRIKCGDGSLHAKLFGGVARRSLELISGGGSNDLEISSLYGGRISYEDEQLRLSLGYGRATIGSNLRNISELIHPLTAAAPLWPDADRFSGVIASKNRILQFFSTGVAYENNNWLLQSEAGYLDSNWPVLPDLLSGYVSVGYQIDEVTPYLILAAAKSRHATPAALTAPTSTGDPGVDAQLSEIYAGALQLSQGGKVDQKSVSLGMRWDLYQNVALKFQWDFSKVAAHGGNLWWGPSTPVTDTTYVNLLSSSVNVAF
jgi:hypothetical protein